MKVEHNMLSDYARSFGGKLPKPCKKLILSLRDKNDVCHTLSKLQILHLSRIEINQNSSSAKVQSDLRGWSRTFRNVRLLDSLQPRRLSRTCTNFRPIVVSGRPWKTCEVDRTSVSSLTVARQLKQWASRPNVHGEIINKDLVMVKGAHERMLLNKPISADFTILELSKLVMYQFHYEYILPTYGPTRARLMFTDTDSLTYHITTDDLYDDMAKDIDRFDTSNFVYPERRSIRFTRSTNSSQLWENSNARLGLMLRNNSWDCAAKCTVSILERTCPASQHSRA